MHARFLLFFAVLFGLTLSPVQSSLAGCEQPARVACSACCTSPGEACCAASAKPNSAPIANANSGAANEQLPAPAFVILFFRPKLAAEKLVVQRQQTVRFPARPLLDLNCICLV